MAQGHHGLGNALREGSESLADTHLAADVWEDSGLLGAINQSEWAAQAVPRWAVAAVLGVEN